MDKDINILQSIRIREQVNFISILLIYHFVHAHSERDACVHHR
jgi:hypothetical protein